MNKKMALWVLGSVLAAVLFVVLDYGRLVPYIAHQNDSVSQTSADTAKDSPDDSLAYQKYKLPVVLHIGFKVPQSNLPPGDSNDNNPISRYFESLTNIHVVHSWEANGDDDFKQKVDLAIDSNDIPDAFVVDSKQLKTLVDRDMIQDLTGTYAAYASDLVRSIYDSTQGVTLRNGTLGGKLYGLPNVALDADSTSLLWIRQDWLDKLNLQPPKTMEDIAQIGLAFVTKDPDGNGKNDTVGLSGFTGITYGEKPLFNGFDEIFYAFHAFPKNWIRDERGNIEYGSIASENKTALALLADWYKRGVIDQNFALYKDSEEPIIENKTGLFFGPWWMPYYPLNLSVENDTKAEWRAYSVPVDGTGAYVTHMAPVTDRYLVVRKGYDHPEAALKLLNVFTRLERNRDPHTAEVNNLNDYVKESAIQPRQIYPFDLLLDYPNSIENRYTNVQKALKGETTPSSLDPDSKNLYDYTLAERENPKKNLEHWKEVAAYQYGVGTLATTRIQKVYSDFYGSTPTMETKWTDLQNLENETFLKIILGSQPVDSFDDFVRDWKGLGGDQITKEVEDAINRR